MNSFSIREKYEQEAKRLSDEIAKNIIEFIKKDLCLESS